MNEDAEIIISLIDTGTSVENPFDQGLPSAEACYETACRRATNKARQITCPHCQGVITFNEEGIIEAGEGTK